MSGADSPRERALSAWREGRYAEARDATRAWVAAEPRSAEAHQLDGQAAARLGDAHGAARSFEAAESLGGDVACAFNAGNAWKAAGNREAARAAWRRAARHAASLGPHAAALAKALGKAGDVAAAAEVWRGIVGADPDAFDAIQALVDLASADRASATSPLPLDSPGDRPPPRSFSFVICSIDASKFDAISVTIAARFAELDVELIRIGDATSLCEGYRRGLARARGDAIVFCHDDIDLLAPDAAHRLARHLTRHDLVGVAGTTQVTGPAVFWSGHPHIHGWMTHRLPGEDAYETSFSSLAGPVVAGMQAIDGVLMACRRELALAVPFDEATFDGFHLYDLDFSVRAHRAGWRLAVACDLGIVHASKGRFDAAWERYAARFRAKYPELSGARGAPHWYATRVATPYDVLAVQARLRELAVS
ncbi:MAG: glycosyltransferase [Betaproteobacteria bacterium]